MAVPTLPNERPPERRVETVVFAKVDSFKSLNYHTNERFIICINMYDTLIDLSTVLMCHIYFSLFQFLYGMVMQQILQHVKFYIIVKRIYLY